MFLKGQQHLDGYPLVKVEPDIDFFFFLPNVESTDRNDFIEINWFHCEMSPF